jgi:transposase
MIYLLASGQTHTRQDVAHLPGVHRHTMSHWLAGYAAGGLATLLETYVPPSKRPKRLIIGEQRKLVIDGEGQHRDINVRNPLARQFAATRQSD